MKPFSMRAVALLASLSLVLFAACSGDGDGGGFVPVGTQVQLALAPVFDGPERVPPALDPTALRARVTDLTQEIEYHDTTFAVEAGSVFEDALDFEVPGGTAQILLFVDLRAADGVAVWASGPDTIVIPEEGEPGTVSPVLQWVGPGAGAARLQLSPDEVALDAGGDTTLVVTAFDQDGNPVEGTAAAVDWVSLSPEVGDFVDQSGRWQSFGARGEVQVVATLSPQQLADTALIIVQAAPRELRILGGGEQAAPAGSTLPEPVEVQVIATDGEPLAGRAILFQPQNDGAVGEARVVSDAEGVARTSWTLGPAVGSQTLRMEIEGRPEIFASVSAEAEQIVVPAPTEVTSTPESGGAPPGGITVSWSIAGDSFVEFFEVERSVDGGLSWRAVDGGVAASARSLVDEGPSGRWARDERVLHRVRACSAEAEGCSGWVVSSAPAYTLPNAPRNLTAEAVESRPTGTIIAVRWEDSNRYETGYLVCDTDGPSGSCTVRELEPGESSIRFETSVPGDSALITVTARNPAGDEPASVWVQLVTLEDFSIAIVSGDEQAGLVGSPVANPLVVEVRDPFGAAAEGVEVAFTPSDGGTAAPAAATTNAEGRASTTWTLGAAAGSQSLLAELVAAPSVLVEFTAEAAPAPIDPPTGVAAQPVFAEGEFDGFSVSWQSSDDAVERFRVERRLSDEESWTTVADSLGGEASVFFDGSSLPGDRRVTYRVQGCDAAASNCSAFGVSSEGVYTPPVAPTQLSGAVVGYGQSGPLVRVSWVDNNDFATRYEVCDAEQEGGDCLSVTPVDPGVGALTFETSASGDSVYVSVTAVNPTGRAVGRITVELGLPPGLGAVEGRVVEAVSEVGLVGATVTLVPTGSGEQVQTGTDAQGNYRTPPVSPGSYRLVVEQGGYVRVDYFGLEVVADQYTVAERVPMAPGSGVPGVVTGLVQDAQDLDPLPGSQVSLFEGMNVEDVNPVASALTNALGEYALVNVPAGTYTLQASVLGYSTARRTVVSVGDTETGGQDIFLSPAPLTADEVRIVLTWGEFPADLDAHLTGPVSGDERFHVYYPASNRGSLDSIPFASLDVDVTTSFGPETITISQQSPGIYRYSVHDYTNRSLGSSTGLSASGARVEVYQNGELQGRFFVPSGGGTLWTVFELNNGQVTPVNQLSYESNPGFIQAPRPPGVDGASAVAEPVKGGMAGVR